MNNLTLDNLNIAIDKAISEDANFFGIAVNVGLSDSEIIINTVDNMIDGKLSYYMNAYTDDLKLKAKPEISITGFTFGDRFSDIEDDLLG